jgi:hypothetical protein
MLAPTLRAGRATKEKRLGAEKRWRAAMPLRWEDVAALRGWLQAEGVPEHEATGASLWAQGYRSSNVMASAGKAVLQADCDLLPGIAHAVWDAATRAGGLSICAGCICVLCTRLRTLAFNAACMMAVCRTSLRSFTMHTLTTSAWLVRFRSTQRHRLLVSARLLLARLFVCCAVFGRSTPHALCEQVFLTFSPDAAPCVLLADSV